MNVHVANTKKDLVPRFVVNGSGTYIAFVHESSLKPRVLFDLLEKNLISEYTPKLYGDCIYKLSLFSYFELNDKLMSRGTKYNLMKKRHEYNRRKYGKIRSKNN